MADDGTATDASIGVIVPSSSLNTSAYSWRSESLSICTDLMCPQSRVKFLNQSRANRLGPLPSTTTREGSWGLAPVVGYLHFKGTQSPHGFPSVDS